MDPKEAYRRALAFEPGAAQDLIEWLERGGALPVPTSDPKFSRDAFMSALRKLAAIADKRIAMHDTKPTQDEPGRGLCPECDGYGCSDCSHTGCCDRSAHEYHYNDHDE